jgi:hypothetical protein
VAAVGVKERINGFVTGTATAPAPVPAANVQGGSNEYYFSLEIVEENPADPFAPLVELPIAPCAQLHVRVSTSETGQPGQLPLRVNAGVVLQLMVEGVSDQDVRVQQRRHDVALADLGALAHEFEVKVQDICARGTARFVLLVSADGKRALPAAVLERSVNGNINRIDPVLLDEVRLDLEAVTPEHFAILHIEQSEPDKYRIKGWNRRLVELKLERQELDDTIGLASFVEAKVAPADVLANIRSVSRRAPQPLISWLQQLYQCYAEKVCLVIADHTSREIPWEALEIADNQHIGTSFAVARWIPVQNFAQWVQLRVENAVQRGAIVAHLDHSQLPATDRERAALDQFRTTYLDRELLEDRLAQPLADVCLVYLATHGMFVYNDPHKIAVGSFENPSQRLTAVRLEVLNPQTGARPLFFVNACHSARLLRGRRGLCIGEALLGHAGQSAQGINAAEALRQIRARAVAELLANPSPAAQLACVFVFMYVFFGNPLAEWQLAAVEKASQP